MKRWLFGLSAIVVLAVSALALWRSSASGVVGGSWGRPKHYLSTA